MATMYIVPKKTFQSTVEAGTKDEAITKFAFNMDSDMNNYFDVVTEDELPAYLKNQDSHEETVKSFMKDELMNTFGYKEEKAEDLADAAYELYTEGKAARTEYGCIEKTVEDDRMAKC